MVIMMMIMVWGEVMGSVCRHSGRLVLWVSYPDRVTSHRQVPRQSLRRWFLRVRVQTYRLIRLQTYRKTTNRSRVSNTSRGSKSDVLIEAGR